MSHQTGIKPSEALKKVFCRSTTTDEIRLVKVGIKNEKLECEEIVEKKSGSWRDEYDSAVIPLLKNDQPCYMFLKMEEDRWLFIAYTPDKAQVRQKMLFSGTRTTVKAEFGGGLIEDELIGTCIEDVTLSGYAEHVRLASVPPPLTDAEEEKKLIKAEENTTKISVATRQQTTQGLSFPLTNDLIEKIHSFKNCELNYLQLKIDLDDELIYLSSSGDYEVDELEKKAPVDDAYYHIYRYEHTFEGKLVTSLIFIYAMPGYKSPIKSRMLYSSCKGTLLDELSQSYGIDFDKKMELQDQAISADYLISEIHPPTAEMKEKFLKPKAPGRRGSPRRTNRPTNGSS